MVWYSSLAISQNLDAESRNYNTLKLRRFLVARTLGRLLEAHVLACFEDLVDRHAHLFVSITSVAIQHDEFQGLRVSPSVYTTLEELDRFCDVMRTVIRDGLETA